MSSWRSRLNGAGRKLRGILGLSFIGGSIAAVFAGSATLLASLWGTLQWGMAPAWTLELVLAVGSVFFAIGAIGTAGFTTLLAATSHRIESVGDVPLLRAASLGTLAGFTLPILFSVPFLGVSVSYFVSQALPGLAVFGAMGGALSTTLVVAAQRAHARELASDDDPGLLPADVRPVGEA